MPENSPLKSRGPVVPLSNIQSAILKLLAKNRNPESYVAGSTPLNRDGPRYSGDIDIFHDLDHALETTSKADIDFLTECGFSARWLRQLPGIHSAEVSRNGERMKLEWVRDSDFRFFPTVQDDLFGYTLHIADIATNKAMAAAGRRAARDVLDLILIHEKHLPLGAVIWAAVEKAPGFSPEAMISEIRRNSNYRQDEFAMIDMIEPVDAGVIAQKLRTALEEAEAFVRNMPPGKEGLLFLRDGQPVQPDPEHLENYTEHSGQRRGHWPTTSEITHEMLKAYLDNSKEQ
jgi:hypothetical protein